MLFAGISIVGLKVFDSNQSYIKPQKEIDDIIVPDSSKKDVHLSKVIEELPKVIEEIPVINLVEHDVNDKSKQESHFVKFNEQEVEYPWADEFSEELYNHFAIDNNLVKYNVKEIECRSSLCLIEVYIGDNDPMGYATDLGKDLTSGFLKGHSFYFYSYDDFGTVTVEVGRYQEKLK